MVRIGLYRLMPSSEEIPTIQKISRGAKIQGNVGVAQRVSGLSQNNRRHKDPKLKGYHDFHFVTEMDIRPVLLCMNARSTSLHVYIRGTTT